MDVSSTRAEGRAYPSVLLCVTRSWTRAGHIGTQEVSSEGRGVGKISSSSNTVF